MVERWRMWRTVDGQDRWEINLVFEDPVILLAPVRGRQLMERAEPGTVVGGYNCPQSAWDDYVASVQAEREGLADDAGDAGDAEAGE